MLHNRQKVGIVVPCWNEAERLSVTDFMQFCDRVSEIGFVFVNDGSSDNTRQILEDLARTRTSRVDVINLERNEGKAQAIRVGIKEILSSDSFELVGYWDADLSAPLDEIPRFIEVFNNRTHVQFVCGSRIRKMGSSIERGRYRHYLGRCFATAASIILRLPVYDTQCGAKIIKAELATRIFDAPFVSKLFFDVELLARTVSILGEEHAKQAIFELPLDSWMDKGGSKRKMCDYMRAACALLRISQRYKR